MGNAALEALLSKYNWWMGLSTIAVALGILGEYVAHFIFERDAKPNRIEMFLGVLFAFLVLGGVVGEYIFGSKLSDATGRLQRQADVEVAMLGKSAAEAAKDAAEAKTSQQGLEIQLAQQQERAATAEKFLLELRERMKPRFLTAEQIAFMVEEFKANPNAGEVNVQFLSGDDESFDFAKQIAAALSAGGWRILGPTEMGSSLAYLGGPAGPAKGLFIGISDDPGFVPARARVLQRAFKGIGIAAPPLLGMGMPGDVMNLYIGAKP
jgi:hypothetical protein